MGWMRSAAPRLPARRGTAGTRGGWPLFAALAGVAAGCGAEPPARPVRPEFDLHHPSGSIRMQAVEAVAARRDATHLPGLVDRLDDDDPAVRLAAGGALRDLTGHDTGYRAWMESPERRRHQALWRARLGSRAPAAPRPQTGVPAPRPTPVPPPPDARRP